MVYVNERFKSETTEWETPESLFSPLNDEFHFTLDVCANAENTKCDIYFNKEQDAFKQEWKEWPSISAPQKGSIAEGLAITQPVRWKHIVQAIQASCGLCVKVAEDEIIQAQQLLAEQGFFVEPTSAVVIAALKKILKTKKLERNETVVISLTGSGLKASPTTQQGMNPV